MISHVLLQEVDPKNPSSLSPKVIKIAKSIVGPKAILITDDLNMRPTYHRKGGIGKAVYDAINADIDYVLLSYRGESYYPAMRYLLKSGCRK